MVAGLNSGAQSSLFLVGEGDWREAVLFGKSDYPSSSCQFILLLLNPGLLIENYIGPWSGSRIEWFDRLF